MFKLPKLLFRFHFSCSYFNYQTKIREDIMLVCRQLSRRTQCYQPKLSTDLAVESINPTFLYNGLLSKVNDHEKKYKLVQYIQYIYPCSIVLLLVGTASTISMQSSHAQLQGLVNNQTDTSQNPTKTIQISVIEEEEVYRWANIQGRILL